MTSEQRNIKDLIYNILGKTESEIKIDNITKNIIQSYQKLRIASLDFEIAADIENSITDKEWLHTAYSLLRQRQRELLRLWEVAFNLGIADRTNDKRLLAEIMPRLEKMREPI